MKAIKCSETYWRKYDAGDHRTIRGVQIRNRNQQALSVYEIQAPLSASGNFNLSNFNMPEATDGKWYWWGTNNGN